MGDSTASSMGTMVSSSITVIPVISSGETVGGLVGDSVGESVGDSVGESVGDAEGISVGEGEGALVTTGARVAIRT